MARGDASSGNRLLDALLRDCPGLRGQWRSTRYRAGQPVASAGRPAGQVYFPTTGVLSLVVELAAGGAAEVMTVGNEGLVGLSIWLGVERSYVDVVQQISGEVLGIPARPFCLAVEDAPGATRLLKRFTAYSLRFGEQSILCSTHHSVRQRLCRWLLSAADRAGASRVGLTQAMLATMLGTRRQSVGLVAVSLQRAGLIAYRRGAIEILDRQGLLGEACECYDAMRRAYGALLRPVV